MQSISNFTIYLHNPIEDNSQAALINRSSKYSEITHIALSKLVNTLNPDQIHEGWDLYDLEVSLQKRVIEIQEETSGFFKSIFYFFFQSAKIKLQREELFIEEALRKIDLKLTPAYENWEEYLDEPQTNEFDLTLPPPIKKPATPFRVRPAKTPGKMPRTAVETVNPNAVEVKIESTKQEPSTEVVTPSKTATTSVEKKREKKVKKRSPIEELKKEMWKEFPLLDPVKSNNPEPQVPDAPQAPQAPEAPPFIIHQAKHLVIPRMLRRGSEPVINASPSKNQQKETVAVPKNQPSPGRGRRFSASAIAPQLGATEDFNRMIKARRKHLSDSDEREQSKKTRVK